LTWKLPLMAVCPCAGRWPLPPRWSVCHLCGMFCNDQVRSVTPSLDGQSGLCAGSAARSPCIGKAHSCSHSVRGPCSTTSCTHEPSVKPLGGAISSAHMPSLLVRSPRSNKTSLCLQSVKSGCSCGASSTPLRFPTPTYCPHPALSPAQASNASGSVVAALPAMPMGLMLAMSLAGAGLVLVANNTPPGLYASTVAGLVALALAIAIVLASPMFMAPNAPPGSYIPTTACLHGQVQGIQGLQGVQVHHSELTVLPLLHPGLR
jgi:hypothetical protein